MVLGILYDAFQGIVSNNNPRPQGHIRPLMLEAVKWASARRGGGFPQTASDSVLHAERRVWSGAAHATTDKGRFAVGWSQGPSGKQPSTRYRLETSSRGQHAPPSPEIASMPSSDVPALHLNA